jgi:hypothetical protein
MYAAIWRVLPGSRWVKAVLALLLFLIVVAILFTWVFPAIAPLLPFDRVTIDGAVAPPSGRTPVARPPTPRILVVDNYDSFVFTIVGYLEQLGADCTVVRNDAVTPAEGAGFDGVLISPGPGTPRTPACRWR